MDCNSIAQSSIDLHSDECNNTAEDIERMSKLLDSYPELLEKDKRAPANNFNKNRRVLCSNLIDASIRGHYECMKFLVEKGADQSKLRFNKSFLEIYLLNGENLKEKIVNLFSNSSPISPNFGSDDMIKGSCYLLNYLIMHHAHIINKEVMDAIVKAGLNINPMPNLKLTMDNYTKLQPTSYAMMSSVPARVLKLLIQYGAVCSAKDVKQLINNPNKSQREAISIVHRFNLMSMRHPKIVMQKLCILKKLGVNFHERDRFGKKITQAREKRRTLRRDFYRRFRGTHVAYEHSLRNDNTMQEYKDISTMIEKTQQESLTLQDVCRISLMRAHKSKYLDFVQGLEEKNIVPPLITSFLRAEELGEDLFIGDGEEKSVNELA